MDLKPTTNEKHLYRSLKDRIIGGICGGFAEYFNIDSTIVRIAWLFFTFFGGFGLLLYIVCLILMRENPDQTVPENPPDKNVGLLIGAGLIMLGLAFLSVSWDVLPFKPFQFNFFRPWFFRWNHLFPLIIIGIGVYYLYNVLSKERTLDGTRPETANNTRRLLRSRNNRMINGVCGGIADYLKIDPVLVRLLWIFTTLFSGFLLGIIAYIIMLIVVPEEEIESEKSNETMDVQ